MLLEAALIYSLLMALALPSLLPRLLEPLSSRPEALRATWAAAAILPLTPLQPAVGAPVLLAASLLAARGRRGSAAALAAAYALTVYAAVRILQNVP